MNYETHFASDAPLDEAGEQGGGSARRKRIVIALLVAAAVAIALWFAFRDTGPVAPADAGAQAPVVTVISPGRTSVDRVVTATGTVAARVDMPVGIVGEGGGVTRVLVQPGDWVRAGQVLAVVERSVQAEQVRALAAQVESARADAKLAQAQLARAQALVSRGFISQADIDQRTATRDAAVARVNVAIAQLGEQRARTGRLDIRSPAAGLVLTRAVEPGQVVGSGSGVLFRVAKGGEMEMLAQVSEGDLKALRVGNRATVTPIGGTEPIVGHVWQVAPVVDMQNRQGMVRIAIPHSRAVRPGGFASATMISGSGEAPLLPESAVQSDAKGNYVFIVNGKNLVERRDITVGQVSAAGVSIMSGLTGSERIVASAGAFLTPGEKVKPELAKAR